MIYLLCPVVMFIAAFLFVGILWHIQDKAIDKKIKEEYPKWRTR